VYVDKAVALAYARKEYERAYSDGFTQDADGSPVRTKRRGSIPQSDASAKGTRLFSDRLQVPELSDSSLCKAAQAMRSAVKKSADSMEEILETPPPSRHGTKQRITHGSPSGHHHHHQHDKDGHHHELPMQTSQALTVSHLHHNLRAVLEKNTQDSCVDVALEVSLRGGEVLYRLRERPDFPGLYEGLFSFTSEREPYRDVDQTVQLFYRFPVAHSIEYAPRKIGDWFIVREEQLPQNF